MDGGEDEDGDGEGGGGVDEGEEEAVVPHPDARPRPRAVVVGHQPPPRDGGELGAQLTHPASGCPGTSKLGARLQ